MPSPITVAIALTTTMDSLHHTMLYSQRINTRFDETLNVIYHSVLTTVAKNKDTYTLNNLSMIITQN